MDEESELTWSDEEEELWQKLEERGAESVGCFFGVFMLPVSLLGLILTIKDWMNQVPNMVVLVVASIAGCIWSLWTIRRGRTHAKLSAKRKSWIERGEQLRREYDEKIKELEAQRDAARKRLEEAQRGQEEVQRRIEEAQRRQREADLHRLVKRLLGEDEEVKQEDLHQLLKHLPQEDDDKES